MKKPSSPVSPAPQPIWRTLALISFGVNVILLAWALVTFARRERVPAAGPAVVESTRSIAPANPGARALGPYAALGSYTAESNRISDLGWSEAQFAEFIAGMRSSYEGRGVPMDDEAKRLRDEISQRVQKMIAAEQPDPAEEYFRMLREKEGVSRTPSGLHYRLTEPGLGEMATANDSVVISFAGRLPDGRELPALSRARVRMAVRDLLPGLAEGVQLLRVRGKGLVYVPARLAFSEANWPADIPKGIPLAFFVELHEVIPPGK